MPDRSPAALTRPRVIALALLAITTIVTTSLARRARAGNQPVPPPASTRRMPYGTGRGPGSHLCPVGCGRPISPGRCMCRPHWYLVPKPLRDAVWATWRSGAGTGTPEHTAALLAAIRAASQTPSPES